MCIRKLDPLPRGLRWMAMLTALISETVSTLPLFMRFLCIPGNTWFNSA